MKGMFCMCSASLNTRTDQRLVDRTNCGCMFFALEIKFRDQLQTVSTVYLHASNATLGEILCPCCLSNGFKSCPVYQSNESLNCGIIWLSYKSFLSAHCDPACRGLSYYCVQSYSAQGLSFKTGRRIHLRNASIRYPASRQSESCNACEEKVQKLRSLSFCCENRLQRGKVNLLLQYFCWYICDSVGSVFCP